MEEERISIGWAGTGTMGTPMVSNLLKGGYKVYVYNRTASNAQTVVERGAHPVQNPNALWENCHTVFIMVTNTQACEAILSAENGLLDVKDGKNKTIINCSTIGTDSALAFAKAAEEKGFVYIDAPVSGSAGAAQDATLLFLIGSTESETHELTPVFNAMGKKNYHLGALGYGNKAKLAINYLIAINYLAIGETVHFAENMGLEPAEMMDIINNSGAGNVTSRIKTQPIVSNDFTPIAFSLKNMLKDVRLASEAGNNLPLMAGLKSAYTEAAEQGFGDKDVMEILTYLRSLQ